MFIHYTLLLHSVCDEKLTNDHVIKFENMKFITFVSKALVKSRMENLVKQFEALTVTPKCTLIDAHLCDIHDICLSLVGKKIKFFAQYDDDYIELDNCNLVGDALETIAFKSISKRVNINKGPNQSPPDFWCCNKEYAYEQKCFTNQPNFDIANFESFVDQLCQQDGVLQKVFKTKYLVFEYKLECSTAIIVNFSMLNIWNIVGFSGKHPITLQSKRNMWYNIRPSSKKDWLDAQNKPDHFIKAIVTSIRDCPNNITNREEKMKIIEQQYDSLKMKYTF